MTAVDPTTEDALLAAVVAAPEDDLPREVYADWLDENPTDTCYRCAGVGSNRVAVDRYHTKFQQMTCSDCSGSGRVSNGNAERAEFIRIQIEIAKQPVHENGGCEVCGDSPIVGRWCVGCLPERDRLEALRARERALIDRHAAEWFWRPPGFEVTTDPPGRFAGGSWLFVRRGWPDEVRVPTLATWCGGECQRCDPPGSGYRGEGESRWFCGHCRWGQAEGIGREVCKRHPVQVVRVSDKAPHRDRLGIYQWSATGLEMVPESAELPDDLFTAMEGLAGQLGANVLEFDTADAANELLSRALLAVARTA
jgi:uncharacterized protein (TIGR02996 family)